MLTHKQFWQTAIPNIAAGIMAPMGGLISTMFLGHLETAVPLAGVGLGSIALDYIYTVFMFLRWSTLTFAGEAQGHQAPQKLGRVLYRSLIIAVVVGLVVLLISPYASATIFSLFSATGDVEAAGSRYFLARIMSVIPFLGLYALYGWFAGKGQPKFTFYLTTLLGALEIFFSWLFIVQYQGAEVGAGYATAFSELLTFLSGLGLAVWIFQKEKIHLKQKWKNLFDWSEFCKFFTLSRDIFLRTIILITAFTVFLNTSALFGTAFLAGTTVLLRILDFVAFFIDGVALTVQTYVARYWAQRHRNEVIHVLKMGFFYTGLVVCAFIVGGALTNSLWIPVMTDLPLVQQNITDYSLYLALILCFSGLAYLYDGYFPGIQRANYLRDSMIAAGVSFVPFIILVYIYQNPTVLWLGLTTFMLIRMLYLTGVLLKKNCAL